MDEEIERLTIGVRADTRQFSRDVSTMRSSLETGLGAGTNAAARGLETGLARAMRSGKLGFDDLKSVAIRALGAIADATLRAGIAQMAGGRPGTTSGFAATGAGGGGMGMGGFGSTGEWRADAAMQLGAMTGNGKVGRFLQGGLLGALLGRNFPLLSYGGAGGRASGGAVSPDRAFMVGEHGPELFVPGASGRIVPPAVAGGQQGARPVNITIAVQGSGSAAPMLERSSRQVARAVRSALIGAEG